VSASHPYTMLVTPATSVAAVAAGLVTTDVI